MQHSSPLELCSDNDITSINASIILLHGLGADGYDFEPVVNLLLEQSELSNIRFVLPHAPEMPVTRNNGYIMPAWYDVYGTIPVTREDEAGIRASQTYINSLIEKEVQRGISAQRILLAGFSQGGAIALHTALRYPANLAGVIALSSYLPLQTTLKTEASAANRNLPVFMAHGSYDDIISIEFAAQSRDILIQHGYPLEWYEYDMAHSVCGSEINDMSQFIKRVLNQDLVK